MSVRRRAIPTARLQGLLSDFLNGDPTDPRWRMSPDPSTGGRVPLPSFDEDGNYFPPTPVPLRPIRPPANTLAPGKGMDPKELHELLGKIRQSGIQKKLSF